MKKINLIIIILFIFTSCGSLGEAGKVLRNEKTTTTDEFLVKKKQPLILPPDFEKIPAPDTINTKSDSEDERIKKILKAPSQTITTSGKSSSTENSILEKIRK